MSFIFTIPSLLHRSMINSTEDLWRLLYPLSYVLVFRSSYYASCLFPCFDPRDGIHRLASFGDHESLAEDCGNTHEMRSGIPDLAFPDAIFSVANEEDASLSNSLTDK